MPFLWITAALSAAISIFASEAVEILVKHRIPIIGEFAGLVFTENPGVAFGMTFLGPLQFIVILVALALVLWLALKSAHDRWSSIAFGCIIGGAIANVIERLPDGRVTDYFQVGSFPVFNAADSFITVGVALLLLHSLYNRKAAV